MLDKLIKSWLAGKKIKPNILYDEVLGQVTMSASDLTLRLHLSDLRDPAAIMDRRLWNVRSKEKLGVDYVVATVTSLRWAIGDKKRPVFRKVVFIADDYWPQLAPLIADELPTDYWPIPVPWRFLQLFIGRELRREDLTEFISGLEVVWIYSRDDSLRDLLLVRLANAILLLAAYEHRLALELKQSLPTRKISEAIFSGLIGETQRALIHRWKQYVLMH